MSATPRQGARSSATRYSLATPVSSLPGIGSATRERLARLGIGRLQDFLFHLPIRYQDRTRIWPIGSLREGMEVQVEGRILHAEVVRRRRRMLVAVLHDGTGRLTLRFFHFDERMRLLLSAEARLLCAGETRAGPAGLELVHPQFRALTAEEPVPLEARLTPVYPSTEGLSQAILRRWSSAALQCLDGDEDALPEYLPEAVHRGLPALKDALLSIHAPAVEDRLESLEDRSHPALRRLVLEELIAHQLSLMRLREGLKKTRAPRMTFARTLFRALEKRLPYALTAAQRRVIAEIEKDLASAHPMLRLLQGDVGSGKTLVAAAACLAAIEAGHQATIMAPTELLAEQHYRTLSNWLEPLGIVPVLLSGSLSAAERRLRSARVAEGDAQLAIGTHALLQGSVEFKRLGLVVIDEQHRFGVHQRLSLQTKTPLEGLHPHQLVMTATPIPRTLAMAAYAGLDHSIIDQLPPGRVPVRTVAIAESRRSEVVERVRAACAKSQQAYWVCTLIEESEALECETAENTAKTLAENLREFRIGLVHSRMKSELRARTMAEFRDGAVDVLVATTVIEVGVDVPRATVMIIENAERLGLAQLHQLRGRVGRGTQPGYCVLLFSASISPLAKQRLNALRRSSDGFEIARVDLTLRGPGEILGTRQSGLMNLRIADLMRDQTLLPRAATAAEMLYKHHPQIVQPLIERWVGLGLQYAQA